MREQPAVRSLLEELSTAEPEVTVENWLDGCYSAQGLVWPTVTEAGRARLIWAWLQELDEEEDAVVNFGMVIGSGGDLDHAAHDITQQVVAPLFDYLSETIGAESSVLYLLERYIRRVEWFDRQSLYARYTENRQQGEKVYDDDLRRFLFDQGLNMPFSQPKSASGLSDVLGDLDTDDPLLCEVKVFDADSHDKRGIVTGVQQVLNYAQDYNKAIGYLVIINLSGRPLELPTDGPEKAWPRYVDLSGVRVHLLSIRALPTTSASKMGKAKPVTLTRDDLIDPDTADG
jgi:hypothetical protein